MLLRRFASIAVATAVFARAAGAQDPPAQPPLSVLQQLSRETESLYCTMRGGLVRVYLPPPRWALNLMGQDAILKRWDLQLDPTVSQKLRDELNQTQSSRYMDATIKPATQPTSQPADARSYRLVPRGDGSFDLVTDTGEDKAVMDLGPRSVGVVINSQGFVVLPYYIEREAVGDQPLTVACGDGAVCGAKFVGSDRQTGLTVIHLEGHAPTPMQVAGRKPSDGAMVMFLNLTGEVGRLAMWTGTLQDSGVVVSVDGGICGFVRQGQFLESAVWTPVVEQLIDQGKVIRPVLGVFLREILPADPVRRENRALGSQGAVMVMKVMPGSAADRAGVLDGDIVLSLGDEAVGSPPTFAAVMTSLRGATAMHVLRGENTVTLSVDLQPRH